ncbi:MAG TPA: SpoIIE family protein phosphatase [Patescibacteria group bacterium]|nr:SpoIIE family protein phosphatase [Patescibacteria group bacterium]
MKSEDQKKQILDILSGAILRETDAFNYYHRNADGPSAPPAVRGLFSRLAEEERVHRHLLINEFLSVKRGWREEEGEGIKHIPAFRVPDKIPFLPLRTGPDLDAAAVCLPGRLVGGDNVFSAVVRDHAGNATGTFLVLYDAMGHSFETTETNALAARIVGEHFEASSTARMQQELLAPDLVAKLLNEKLHEKFDGQGVFITLFCATFDTRSATMSYTCGGHEPPFVVRADGRVESLLNTQLIVGIDPDFDYTADAVPFGEGDILCIFTDGIVEARNEEGDFFGRSGVQAVLARSGPATPRQLIEDLLEGVRNHSAAELIQDEISIVVVRSKGA